MQGANEDEVIIFTHQRCVACNGNGGRYFDGRSPGYDVEIGAHYKPCPVCKGTGLLEAQVIVGWKPCGDVKECFK